MKKKLKPIFTQYGHYIGAPDNVPKNIVACCKEVDRFYAKWGKKWGSVFDHTHLTSISKGSHLDLLFTLMKHRPASVKVLKRKKHAT